MFRPSLRNECVAEFVGTFLLVLIGTANVTASITGGPDAGAWNGALVWGFALTLAIFVSGQVSGGHLNPAVTISLALSRKAQFPWSKVGPYIAAQFAGAFVSGVCVLVMYGGAISRYETNHSITRGDANSTLSAMAFGEYYPNPQAVLGGTFEASDISAWSAILIEAVGTSILMLMIRVVTDETSSARPSSQLAPIYIGLALSVPAGIFGTFTQACFNPARDLGPRFVAAMAGWSTVAFPGPNGCFWVYIVGPILGAVVSGVVYDFVVSPILASDGLSASERKVVSSLLSDESHKYQTIDNEA